MISVVIPHYLGMLGEVIESVHFSMVYWSEIDYGLAPYYHYEIIVINNNSPEIEYGEDVPYITETIHNVNNIGYSRACNQGIEVAQGEYILLLNSDAILKLNNSRVQA